MQSHHIKHHINRNPRVINNLIKSNECFPPQNRQITMYFYHQASKEGRRVAPAFKLIMDGAILIKERRTVPKEGELQDFLLIFVLILCELRARS